MLQQPHSEKLLKNTVNVSVKIIQECAFLYGCREILVYIYVYICVCTWWFYTVFLKVFLIIHPCTLRHPGFHHFQSRRLRTAHCQWRKGGVAVVGNALSHFSASRPFWLRDGLILTVSGRAFTEKEKTYRSTSRACSRVACFLQLESTKSEFPLNMSHIACYQTPQVRLFSWNNSKMSWCCLMVMPGS